MSYRFFISDYYSDKLYKIFTMNEQKLWLPGKGHHLKEVDSTNDWLKKNNPAVGDWVRADSQTQGRGRGLHQWHSPLGGLYMSVLIPCREPIILTSLAVSNAVVELCENCGYEVQVKWPNDILYRSKKCAGILCEVLDEGVVAGIGINFSEKDLFQGASFLDNNQMSDELAKKLISLLSKWTSISVFEMDIQSKWIENRKNKQGNYLFGDRCFVGEILNIDLRNNKVSIKMKNNRVESIPATQLQELL